MVVFGIVIVSYWMIASCLLLCCLSVLAFGVASVMVCCLLPLAL